jgi:hypothetical protein
MPEATNKLEAVNDSRKPTEKPKTVRTLKTNSVNETETDQLEPTTDDEVTTESLATQGPVTDPAPKAKNDKVEENSTPVNQLKTQMMLKKLPQKPLLKTSRTRIQKSLKKKPNQSNQKLQSSPSKSTWLNCPPQPKLPKLPERPTTVKTC